MRHKTNYEIEEKRATSRAIQSAFWIRVCLLLTLAPLFILLIGPTPAGGTFGGLSLRMLGLAARPQSEA
jgi:hypothetical protein